MPSLLHYFLARCTLGHKDGKYTVSTSRNALTHGTHALLVPAHLRKPIGTLALNVEPRAAFAAG